jgi:L-glutamine-phosphate cytidylyltransferase
MCAIERQPEPKHETNLGASSGSQNQYGDIARRGRPLAAFGPSPSFLADVFYRGDLMRGMAGAPGQLVISYNRVWRRLWTRRFADPLADAETFRMDAAGQLFEIGGKTTRIEDIEGQYMGLLKIHAKRMECC